VKSNDLEIKKYLYIFREEIASKRFLEILDIFDFFLKGWKILEKIVKVYNSVKSNDLEFFLIKKTENPYLSMSHYINI
jgi:hypothetical protein